MTNFASIPALLGGVLIGLSASAMLLLNGKALALAASSLEFSGR